LIETVGGVMSGYWDIGNVLIARSPTKTITIDITIAVTGLLIKTSAIILLSRSIPVTSLGDRH
jgi:hypothetical protein